MVSISKLYCQTVEPSDNLRYNVDSGKIPSHLLHYAITKKTVVVWNITKACNLSCMHCYSSSGIKQDNNELTTGEAKKLIDDLSFYQVPVILFSGGEPLIRNDIFELVSYAKYKNIRTVLSTNGTLLTPSFAQRIKESGVSYAGISIDGMKDANDYFRQGTGLFKKALEGINNCQKENIKVGLRFTIHSGNKNDIPGIFKLLKDNDIKRICFYHLVNTGRATGLVDSALTNDETRVAVDSIIKFTNEMNNNQNKVEVLTVDNHCDGPYLYLKMKKENHNFAEEALNLLRANKGNNSGTGIGCISWDGEVYADQFLRNHSLGNVREKKFSEIWEDKNNILLQKFRNRHELLPERCSACKWLSVCNGNFRARAEAYTGDLWGFDPACYLTDDEIRV